MNHQRAQKKPAAAKTAPGVKGAGRNAASKATRPQQPGNARNYGYDDMPNNNNNNNNILWKNQWGGYYEPPAWLLADIGTEPSSVSAVAPPGLTKLEQGVAAIEPNDAVIEPVSSGKTEEKVSFTTKLKKQQRSYMYCNALHKDIISELQTLFPNIKGSSSPNAEENSHQHPFLATLRANFETYLRFELEVSMQAEDQHVIDIGGNPRRNKAKQGLFSHAYHSCNPILDASDERREHERSTKTNLGSFYCNHTFEECDCVKFTGVMSVDSVYYLNDQELIKACSVPFWACFHDLRGEFGSAPNAKFSEATFVRLVDDVEMTVKGNSQPYQHPAMDWAFTGKKVGDKWIMFEEKMRYGTYVAGRFYLSKFGPTQAKIQLPVKSTPVVENMAPRLMGLTPDEKLNKARRIVVAEKVPSELAAQSVKDMVAVAEALDRRVKVSTRGWFENWRFDFAARVIQFRQMIEVYQYFSKKTMIARWITSILCLLLWWYVSGPIEDYLAGWLSYRYEAPWGLGFFYWLMPSWSQVFHGKMCNWATTIDSYRASLHHMFYIWDYWGFMDEFEPLYTTVYCVMERPWFIEYVRYFILSPLLLLASLLTSLEAINLAPYAYSRTTRVLFIPCDMALKVGKCVMREAKSLKFGRNIDQVIGCNEYQAPIPSGDSVTHMKALKMRLGQGVERLSENGASDWNSVVFDIWDELVIPNMSFETWITEFYGRRDEPAMVAKYREAYATLNDLKPSKFLYVDAFVKVESYPGKLDKIKPRVVQNVSDLRQILRTSIMVASFNHQIKLFQQKEMRPILYSSGYNPLELGRWVEHWRNAGFNHVLENDFSEFESRVSVEALQFEFQIYARKFMGLSGWSQLHHELKRQINPKVSLDGAVYTREGGRCSGVPNTSLGNTILNMSSTIWVLSKMGLKYGTDYVAMFLGDDSYVMTKTVVDHEEVAKWYLKLGFKAETKFYSGVDVIKAEYCSGRFLPCEGSLCWVPKAGRILLKGISVPSDVRNVPEYIAPVMRHYATKVYCPIIQMWAQSYCRINGITWEGEPVKPAGVDVLTDIYGPFKVDWLAQSTQGCWYYSLSDISPFVDVDCPIAQTDDVNNYGVPDRRRHGGYLAKLFHYVMKFYVPTNKVMPFDEVLGYQNELTDC